MNLATELISLLESGVSGNQVELVSLLKNKGVVTTQSSVSRVLKRINAVKGLDDKGNTIYSLQENKGNSRDMGFLDSIVTKILNNEQLIVIHSRPGTANTVAKFIDDRNFDEVLGTVAGDDTILIIPSNITQVKRTVRVLTSFLKNGGIF